MNYNFIDCNGFDDEKLRTLEQRLKEIFGDKVVYLKSSLSFVFPCNTSDISILADYAIKPLETHMRYALEERK